MKSPAPVRLTLVSRDSELATSCREALREMAGSRWEFVVVDGPGGIPASDVCLWDYAPGLIIPSKEPRAFESSRPEQRHLYLVSPRSLDEFRSSVPSAEGSILLKPVTRAVLIAFLSSAFPANGTAQVEIGALRADRDEILQCLLSANLRLQEYDQQRTNFVARAVHDFRAPLTALEGFCGLLFDEHLGPLNSAQKDALGRMGQSAKRLSQLASSMFQLTIHQQVDQEPDLKPGDLADSIRLAVHELALAAEEKGVALSITRLLPPLPGALYFEQGQIQQLLVNLLDNACKVTPRKGSIEIQAYPFFWERRFLANSAGSVERRLDQVKTPNSYRIDITDSGPGIPPGNLAKIFEEYTRYSGSRDRSGGGLGLAICKLIATRHKGKVWAESKDKGATFSFVLPYLTNHPPFSGGDEEAPLVATSENLNAYRHTTWNNSDRRR